MRLPLSSSSPRRSRSRVRPLVGALASTLVVVFLACSSDTVRNSPNGTLVVPEGGTILEDGAVVDRDGNVVTQPDRSRPSKVNATNETVDVLGVPRAYMLTVPKAYDAGRAYPLIIALHGDGQDGPGFRASLAFDDVAGDDAIVAYQTGTDDLFTPYEQNRDQLTPDAIIAAVKAKFSIDPGKVWAFGYSKGGFLANEIACRKPGVLKAMAVHASGAPEEPRGSNGFPQCPGVVGLPTLVTEGELDQGIGGSYAANYWASVNGCGTSRTASTPAGCSKHEACPAQKNVSYCLATGVHHYPIWNEAVSVSWSFFNAL